MMIFCGGSRFCVSAHLCMVCFCVMSPHTFLSTLEAQKLASDYKTMLRFQESFFSSFFSFLICYLWQARKVFFFSACNTTQCYTCSAKSLHHPTEDYFPCWNPESSLKTVQFFLSDESQFCLLKSSGSLRGRFLWSLNYFRNVGGCLPETGTFRRVEDLQQRERRAVLNGLQESCS